MPIKCSRQRGAPIGNAEIAGLDTDGRLCTGVDIAGLDNERQHIDGLGIARLDIVGLDNDGPICGQLTELELLNSIFEKIYTPFLFLKHALLLVSAISCTL